MTTDLSDVMEHLAIAFGGIYEKLTERDMVVNTLSMQIVQLNEDVTALSNRIEGLHRKFSADASARLQAAQRGSFPRDLNE